MAVLGVGGGGRKLRGSLVQGSAFHGVWYVCVCVCEKRKEGTDDQVIVQLPELGFWN